jgi:carbon storage regulator
MLVLSRKVGEAIKLADDIEITVLAVDNTRVRLGIRAPRHISVRRSDPTVPDVNVVEANREAAVPADPSVTAGFLAQVAKQKNKQGS